MSCKFTLSKYIAHDFPSYCLCTAVCGTRGLFDTTFCAIFVAGPDLLLLLLNNSPTRPAPALSTLFSELKLLLFPSLLYLHLALPEHFHQYHPSPPLQNTFAQPILSLPVKPHPAVNLFTNSVLSLRSHPTTQFITSFIASLSFFAGFILLEQNWQQPL